MANVYKVVIPENLSDEDFDKGVETTNKIKVKQRFTISNLKTSTNIPKLVFITDSNKEGWFLLDETDTTSVNDDVNIIVTSTGKRYKKKSVNNTNLNVGYTISQLRSLFLTSNDTNKLFYCIEDGKEGNFKVDLTDTTSVDNLGTILVTTSGVRLKRVLEDGEIFPEWFGAVGDGMTDDTQAVLSMFNLGSNYIYTVKYGKVYFVSNTSDYLELSNISNVRIDNFKFVFKNLTNKGGIRFSSCNNVHIKNISITFANTPTVRDSKYGLYFSSTNNVVANNISVEKTSGAGILCNSSIGLTFKNLKVENTLADGVHFANCSGVNIDNINTNQTGDDGLAFVNYANLADLNGANATNISINNASARGISAVGASNVKVSNFDIKNTSGAGLYVAYESSYNTRTPDNFSAESGTITGAGAYRTGVGNRFGINYSNCLNATFTNVRVSNSFQRGISGVGSNAVVKITDCYVENTTNSDDYNLSGKEVYLTNSISKECNSYGIYVQNVTSLAKITGCNVINASKLSGLNRAIWFNNCASFFCNGNNIIDHQVVGTGKIIGENGNTFGQFQSNIFNISNGAGAYSSSSGNSVRVVKTLIFEGLLTLASGQGSITNSQVTTGSKLYIQTKGIAGTGAYDYTFAVANGSASITARQSNGNVETGCNSQVSYQIWDN